MKSKKPVILENVNPYPFEILHLSEFTISQIPTIGKLQSWRVLEIFRIEALRRCKTVHRLLEKKVPDHKIYDKYGLIWSQILDGKLMELTEARSHVDFNGKWGDGITNLTWRFNEVEKDELSDLIKGVFKPYNCLYIEIDLTTPPHRVIQSLLPYLKLQHKSAQRETICNLKEKRNPYWFYHPPYHSKKKSPIRDVKAWLTYLKCYDLHRCSNASPGQISKYLYASTKKEDNVDKAIKRVKRLIDCAEKNNWPPTKLA